MNITYIAKASSSPSDLTGIGTEFLCDSEGNIIAVFVDGMMNGRTKSFECSKTLGMAKTIPVVDNVVQLIA